MQQFTINFQNKLEYSEEDYIISKSNFNAYYLVKNWENNWKVFPYSKVLAIFGPPSSGKTYLTYIWYKYTKAIFLSPNADINQLYAGEQYFIVDDIDKEWQAEKLLHIFNILHEGNKFLIITSRKLPSECFTLPDLKSRLSAVCVAKIEHPDDEMMKMILIREFSSRSLKVSIEVINYLAFRLVREFRIITKIVQRIDKYSLENKRNITIPLVKELLEKINPDRELLF